MLPFFDVERSILAVGLGAARTIPVAWMVPAFGGPHVPAHIRVGLGLALAVLCLPRIWGQVPDSGPTLWILLLFREVAVGLTLGFAVSAIFRAAEAAGRLTDIVRGANMAEVLSPLEGRTSPLGDVFLLLAVVIFLELGGLGHVATALGRSYDAVPLAAVATPEQLGRVLSLTITTAALLVETAVALAAPAIVALLLADLALGAIGRVAPQIPLYFVGMPLKALLGVGAVLIALGALDAALVDGFRAWAALLQAMLSSWR
jgi:flagellar biosynthesis protein FliR